jgi:hypothetical protein
VPKWVARAGEAFFRVSGPTGSHLNVVLCDPTDFPTYRTQSVICVDICSLGQIIWHDQAVLLSQGDHPFIQHDSYVNYSQAAVHHAASLENLVGVRGYEPTEPVTHELLIRLRDGAVRSIHTPRDIQSFLRA